MASARRHGLRAARRHGLRAEPLAVVIAFERSSSDEPFLRLGFVPLVFSDDVQADWVVNVWDPSVAENAGCRRDHGE